MSKEAMKLALEALELSAVTVDSFGVQQKTHDAITALREALAEQPAQPQQERMAWVYDTGKGYKIVGYNSAAIAHLDHGTLLVPNAAQPAPAPAPAQRKPLTDAELRVIENKINPNMRWRSSDEEGITLYPIEYYELVRAIEAAHGIKRNT